MKLLNTMNCLVYMFMFCIMTNFSHSFGSQRNRTNDGNSGMNTLFTSEDNGKCEIKLIDKSVDIFRHLVYKYQASLVYLRLLPGPGIKITGERRVVGETVWVWTFHGKDGCLEFLNWPVEYGIWSLGLLKSYVISEPMPVQFQKLSGDCSNLVVGNITDDNIISEALLRLALEMNSVTKSDKYSASFFCHTTRKYISPHFLYMLCKHIACPLEAIKHECCNNFFDVKLQHRNIICEGPGSVFEFDIVSWVLPTLLSVILFGFSPVLLLYIAHIFCDGHRKTSAMNQQNNVQYSSPDSQQLKIHDIIFLGDRPHVTLIKTITSPFNHCVSSMNRRSSTFCRSVFKRLLRCFLPFLSLSFIVVQVALDYVYLRTFVLSSLQTGVPLGFRSLIAGYEESKQNFLPYFGGPYVAICSYLLIACILLGIPDSISAMLLSGIPKDSVNESLSPIKMRLQSIIIYGCVKVRNYQDYKKLLSVLQAQFFMLINFRYWKYIFDIQYNRWIGISARKSWCCILTPFYVLFCLFETILCLFLNGFPILSFGVIIIKAYCGRLISYADGRACLYKSLFGLLTFVVVVSVVYFLFLFCTIFMDACLFVTRVITFTFTGIVVYPKVAYGYIIFYCTVLYYIAQCVLDFSGAYHSLLRETVTVCEKLQRKNDSPQLVLQHDDQKGVQLELFEYVIEEHLPRRKQVFLSLLKVGIILTFLGLLLNVLIETDGFRDLHIIMHVGTTLFICALPQILKTCYNRAGNKHKQKKQRRDITLTVKRYQSHVDSSDNENGHSIKT